MAGSRGWHPALQALGGLFAKDGPAELNEDPSVSRRVFGGGNGQTQFERGTGEVRAVPSPVSSAVFLH